MQNNIPKTLGQPRSGFTYALVLADESLQIWERRYGRTCLGCLEVTTLGRNLSEAGLEALRDVCNDFVAGDDWGGLYTLGFDAYDAVMIGD